MIFESQSWPITAELIKAGADVSVRDEQNSTILHWAAAANELDAINVILDHGLDIDVFDCYGETALHDAGRHGLLNAVKELIERGANIFAKNKNGRTPHNMIVHEINPIYLLIQFELEHAMAGGLDDGQGDEVEVAA